MGHQGRPPGHGNQRPHPEALWSVPRAAHTGEGGHTPSSSGTSCHLPTPSTSSSCFGLLPRNLKPEKEQAGKPAVYFGLTGSGYIYLMKLLAI